MTNVPSILCPGCGVEMDVEELDQGCCTMCREDDDREYIDDDIEEILDEQAEQHAQFANDCTCGAWQFTESLEVIHVADCCCGADAY